MEEVVVLCGGAGVVQGCECDVGKNGKNANLHCARRTVKGKVLSRTEKRADFELEADELREK